MECYVVSTWVTRVAVEGEEGVTVCEPSVLRDYPGDFRDVTNQEGPKIASGHFVVLHARVSEKVYEQISSDPLYQVIPISGKPLSEEREHLESLPAVGDHVKGLPVDASFTEIKEKLVSEFKKQVKHGR